MGNFGFSGEMVFLFFLALILFGPKKLPEIGRTIGRFMNEFRRASNEFRSQIESEINASEYSKPQILPPTTAPLGSLASRIFNPPAPEQLQAAEAQAEAQATETPTASAVEVEHAAVAPENAPPAQTHLAASPASKVAPDA
jgi:TatA/E family protein of Tat protein translocase